MTMIAAVAVVAVVVVAAVGFMFLGGNNDEGGDATIASQLQIRGNANDDYTIDDKDMTILEDVMAGNSKLSEYPLADVNNDGKVDNTDKQLLQDLIDRKTGTTVYVICIDRTGAPTTVEATYPLRNVVTYGTNMQMPTLFANGGKYMAGYFSTSYATAESSISSSAVDLEGGARTISDTSWSNFTNLDATTAGGVGALLVDYSGVSQITASRVDDLNAAKIPLIIYPSANTEDEITTVLTLGFLFGGDCETIGVKYAQASWNVLKEIDDKVKDMKDEDRTNYICCTMWYYICQNDSTYNTSPATAGGIPYYKINSDFADTYSGSSSTKMSSVEALSNYTNIECIINNRSMDWGLDSEAYNNQIVSEWTHLSNSIPTYEYFTGHLDGLVYVNNLLPGAVKVAYMAHALYGDLFSIEWADGVLEDFIDLGTEPLEEQTTSTILAYIDKERYEAAAAATA
ncbi:MAG: dockerin type I repeat-containing protein [Candidatus Methanomethylophilaceae archaeon]